MGGSRTFHTPLGALIDLLSRLRFGQQCSRSNDKQSIACFQTSSQSNDSNATSTDTNDAKLVSVEVMAGKSPLTTAIVTKRMARWLFEEVDAEEVEQTGVA